MIDPLLVPLTGWLFPEPAQEAVREAAARMSNADPHRLSLAPGGTGPPPAELREAGQPVPVRACS